MLLERIAGLNADVLCLQEVEEDAYQALAAKLSGYEGRYAHKGKQKPDGCATFWRGAALLAERTVRFDDGTGHLALLLEFDCGGQRLGVANTHLKWEPPEAHANANTSIALGQMRALLGALDAGGAWIACGDFNAEPDSAVMRQALDAGWRDPWGGQDVYSCYVNGVAQRVDYLLHTAALAVQPSALPATEAAASLPSEAEPSDHLPVAAVVVRQG